MWRAGFGGMASGGLTPLARMLPRVIGVARCGALVVCSCRGGYRDGRAVGKCGESGSHVDEHERPGQGTGLTSAWVGLVVAMAMAKHGARRWPEVASAVTPKGNREEHSDK